MDKMRDKVYQKWHINNVCTNRPNTPSSSLHNILDKNDNSHRNEANRSQLDKLIKLIKCFVSDHPMYIFSAKKGFSSVISHLVTPIDVGF